LAEVFVGAYSKARVHDAYVTNSGARCGTFSRLPAGTQKTCDSQAVHFANSSPELVLEWTAPPAGRGTLVVRATVAGKDGVRSSLSFTLAEVKKPKKNNLFQAAQVEVEEEKKFDFQASTLHQLFIELVRNQDFDEAANMVAPNARLKHQNGFEEQGEVVKGREAVMAQIFEYMANGVSVVKDAKDVDPGKSSTVILLGTPLEEEEAEEALEEETEINEPLIPAPQLKLAEMEMRRVMEMRRKGMACSEEVRGLWAPSTMQLKEHRPTEIANKAADELM
jgi:hypothetical protein